MNNHTSAPEAKRTKVQGCPYDAKEETKFTPTTKAYKNLDFLNSKPARSIRIMCEFEEPRRRMRENKIQGTLLIFGSARSLAPEDHAKAVAQCTQELESCINERERQQLSAKLDRLQRSKWMSAYCTQAQELARRLTEWTMTEEVRLHQPFRGPAHAARYLTEDMTSSPAAAEVPQRIVVCTGGGPGVMEAANRGAASVPGAKTMGMGISLPFQKGPNQYLTPELAFEFHYFFTRKFWMVYQAHCIIVFPGGFGTFDELFEAVTLKQTGKLRRDLPIVLFGKSYWEKVINWQAMVELGTMSQVDIDEMTFTDDVDEAYHVITTSLTPNKMDTSPLLNSAKRHKPNSPFQL